MGAFGKKNKHNRGLVTNLPGITRPAVSTYGADELHRILVEDAVKRHPTDLLWAAQAYERIGRLSGKGAEQAYVDVVDEVEALTGSRLMPMG